MKAKKERGLGWELKCERLKENLLSSYYEEKRKFFDEMVKQANKTIIKYNIMEEIRPRDLLGTRPNAVRKITIKQIDRGYIVKVGCKEFAVESADVLIGLLGQYIKSPDETERKFNENTLF